METGDNLINSDLFESGKVPIKDYLFHCVTGLITFVVIEEEMVQLNDFCVICLESVSMQISKLKDEHEQLVSGGQKFIDPKWGDISSDAAMFISGFYLPRWQDTQDFLVRAMCLLLLSTFTEKSLKSLCLDFAPTNSIQPKIKRGQSKISSYLNYLVETCGFNFNETQETLEMREKCRILRNSFAHGDWEDVREKVSNVILQKAFMTVGTLLRSIEDAYYNI